MSTATLHIGDVFDVMRALPDNSVDLILTSPPFLALRSYLPADHPDKGKEIGSEATPAEFLDTLLALTAEWGRLLGPYGSICVELGDTYSGSGGGGGDYLPGGMREGQAQFAGAAATMRESNAAHWRQENAAKDAWPLDKSLCGIPHLYHLSLAYGRNILTGQESPAGQWRVRNVVAWCRPNPAVGALGDKFRPATSYMTIATKARDRWFDLDAVRTEHKKPEGYTRRRDPNEKHDSLSRRDTLGDYEQNAAGAPPLDWWEISTEAERGTSRRVRVPVDVGGDGIQRTTSPDCPVHGSLDQSDPTPRDGEREDGASTRNGRIDDHHAQGQLIGFAPTSLTLDQSDSSQASSPPDGDAATPRSKPSRKMARARSTNPADTPSAGSPDRTADTSVSRVSSDPHPGTSSSSTAEACRSVVEPETPPHTFGMSDPSSACSCSYYVEVEVGNSNDTSHYAGWPTDAWVISTESYPGQHYATWPRKLLDRPIQAMCPRQVCTECGEPRRRIVGYQESHRSLLPIHLRERREASGFSVSDVAGWFDGESVRDWERTDGKHAVPPLDTWPTLKKRLDLDPIFDPVVERFSATTYVNQKPNGSAVAKGRKTESPAHAVRADAIRADLGWTDCGHDSFRPGVVLDPFAGSGTTLAVATGHGRDAIGIDIDSRNEHLVRERVGMLLTDVIDHRSDVPLPEKENANG